MSKKYCHIEGVYSLKDFSPRFNRPVPIKSGFGRNDVLILFQYLFTSIEEIPACISIIIFFFDLSKFSV